MLSMSSNNFRTQYGRQIYNSQLITPLNKTPVINLTSHVMGLVKGPDELPLPLHDLVKFLLVDGSVILYDGTIQDGEQVFSCSDTEAFTYVLNADEQLTNIVRHYYLDGSTWTIEDLKNFNTNKPIIVASTTAPLEAVIIIQNGLGILYDAQRTLWEIENIFATMRKNTNDDSLKAVFKGYMGHDAKLNAQMSGGHRYIAVPGDVDIIPVSDQSLTKVLMEEFSLLIPEYKRATYDIQVSETSNASAAARKLTMRPLIAKVESLQYIINKTYALFGIEIMWGQMIFDDLSVTDRYALLAQMKADGVISEQEFIEAARDLGILG